VHRRWKRSGLRRVAYVLFSRLTQLLIGVRKGRGLQGGSGSRGGAVPWRGDGPVGGAIR